MEHVKRLDQGSATFLPSQVTSRPSEVPGGSHNLWNDVNFAVMATVYFYPHIFTGSVGRRILLVVPVDTLYRTSIISSSTVLPLNPFVNLSLAPLSLFLIYGPDLDVWPDCWVSAEFLRTPIPRKGSGSITTTTSTPNFRHFFSRIIGEDQKNF